MSYWNDIRDDLDALYFASASFVKTKAPKNQRYWELSIDISQPKGKNTYMQFCYFYEDSKYEHLIPLVFRQSDNPDATLCLKYNDTIITQEIIDEHFYEGESNAVRALFEQHP